MLISLQDVLDLWRKYGLKGGDGPSLRSVAHAGGHYAEELDDYLAAGFDPIVFFEPLAANCDVIRERINSAAQWQKWHRNRIVLHECALGAHRTTRAPMFVSSNEAQSSSLLRPTHHTVQYPGITFQQSEYVVLMPLDSFFLTPDLLAMDTQGYELEVLKGATLTLRSVKVVYTEVSNVPLYQDSALIDDIDHFLFDFGFDRVKTEWTGGTWGDAVYVKVR